MAWIWHQSGSPGKTGRYDAQPVLKISLITEPARVTLPVISPFLLQQDIATLPEQKPSLPPAQSTASDKTGFLPSYYSARELNDMPIALSEPDLQQPAAPGAALKGKVSIRLWLNESGEIDRIAAVQSDLPAEIEAMALAAFLKMRFRPGKIKDIPVKSWVDVVIQYDDGQLRPGESPAAQDTISTPARQPPGSQ
jgi:TonB family protein